MSPPAPWAVCDVPSSPLGDARTLIPSFLRVVAGIRRGHIDFGVGNRRCRVLEPGRQPATIRREYVAVAGAAYRFRATPDYFSPVQRRELAASEQEAVATISAAGGCRFTCPHRVSSELAQGEIHLESGLMEITYKSGSKVILQGPAVFLIDSRNGGYLQSGKLTASAPMPKDFAAAKAAASPPDLGMVDGMWPLMIRTRNVAIVDCGGSQFGVWAERPTATFLTVFRRGVNLIAPDFVGRQAMTLNENESLRMEAEPGQGPLLTLYPPMPAGGFARELPKDAPAYSIEIHAAKRGPIRPGRSCAIAHGGSSQLPENESTPKIDTTDTAGLQKGNRPHERSLAKVKSPVTEPDLSPCGRLDEGRKESKAVQGPALRNVVKAGRPLGCCPEATRFFNYNERKDQGR